MATEKDTISEINWLKFTAPLFFHAPYVVTGHGTNTPNATATFVHYGNHHFAVTCAHVIQQLNPDLNESLDFMVERLILPCSFNDMNHRQISLFRVPDPSILGWTADIAIAEIDCHWPYIRDMGNKSAIDLDVWSTPNWAMIEHAHAYGWMNEQKEEQDDRLAIKGIKVGASLSSKLNDSSRHATFHTGIGNNPGTPLSGISGGLTVGLSTDFEFPLGIVFEGYPGGSNSLVASGSERFLTETDVFFRTLVLTPSVFVDWLRALP